MSESNTGPTTIAATTDPATGRLRYPGAPPFGDSPLDERLFFGREVEAEEALHSILSHELFVLYARSGVGKTSLLKARVVNRLRERDLWPVFVRMADSSASPTELVRQALADENGRNSIEVVGAGDTTLDLFELLRSVRIWKDDILQMPVLVFDQFEELFTLWDTREAERTAFIEQLARSVRGVPAERLGDGSTVGTIVRPRVKVVLSLREEFLAELDVFAPSIPKVLSHRQRLEPLSAEQAERAIRGPADLEHPHLADTSPRFSYDQSAVDAILGALTGSSGRAGAARAGGRRTPAGDGVDVSQLQIVCRHIETEIVAGRPDVTVTSADLAEAGGPTAILTGFYTSELDKLDSRSATRKVRELCEVKLISNGRRRSLDVEALGADERLLDDLVDRRLLRKESRAGRFHYELAHDSLVEPLTEYRRQRAQRTRTMVAGGALAAVIATVGILAFVTGRSKAGDGDADVAQAPPTVPAAEPVAIGALAGGTITAEGEVDRFEFTAEAGSAIAVTLTPLREFDGDVEVRNADAASIARADAALEGGGEVTAVIVDETGTHEVAVTGAAGSTGAYELQIDTVDRLGPGDALDRAIGSSGAVGQFPFGARAGEAITIEVTPGSEVDATLAVVDSNGVVIAASDSGRAGDTEVVTLIAPDDATLVAQVRGTDGATGSYSIRRADTVALIDGRAVDGSIEADGEVARYPFAGRAGTVATVDVTPEGGLNATIEVLDPAGSRVVLTDSTGSGQAETVAVSLPLDGTYVVAVRGRPGSTGPFAIRLDESEIADIRIGETQAAVISGDDPVGAFRFEGRTDQLLTVLVEPTSDLDPVIEVLDPGDVTLARSDSFGATIGEIATVRSREDGQYLVFVLGGDSEGSYELTVLDRLVALDDGTDPVEITSNGEVDLYQFLGEADSVVAVTMQPSVDSSLDGQLTLVGPSGQEIAFGDEEFGADPETILAVLPDGGIYTVAARGFTGSTGSYQMQLSRPRSTRVAAESSTDGTIEGQGDLAVVRFSTRDPGTRLRVDLRSTGRLEFDLIDPAPTFDVVVEHVVAGDLPALLTLRREGVYHLVVRGRAASRGDFTLGLSPLDVGVLASGESITGELETEGEIDIYEFSGTAGSPVKLSVQPGDGLAPTVALLDASTGEQFGFPSVDADGTTIREGFLPDDGAYLVYVQGDGGSTGGYTLSRN